MGLVDGSCTAGGSACTDGHQVVGIEFTPENFDSMASIKEKAKGPVSFEIDGSCGGFNQAVVDEDSTALADIKIEAIEFTIASPGNARHHDVAVGGDQIGVIDDDAP